MAKSWRDLTLDEAVERAKGVSRQALHIAIKTYTSNGRLDIVEQLHQVRKTLKRDKRIAKVGKEVVEAVEADLASREARIAEFEALEAVPVKGSGGKWSVTREGKVWSHCQCRWLKPSKVSSGYFALNGAGGKLYVHRVVAIAFVPNPEGKATVNHVNGDKADNRAANLEWSTLKENINHAVQFGLYKVGEDRSSATLTNAAVAEIKAELAEGRTVKDVAATFNTTYGIVYAIHRGQTWKHVQKLDR